ncbi:hypothetical protein ABIE41_002142 [Bosea sp. OAE506]|uniref:hypothetical protein n=1 Tax=Bosea sp. OAE506 TaxID=2663870 RepID=UPI001789FEFA
MVGSVGFRERVKDEGTSCVALVEKVFQQDRLAQEEPKKVERKVSGRGLSLGRGLFEPTHIRVRAVYPNGLRSAERPHHFNTCVAEHVANAARRCAAENLGDLGRIFSLTGKVGRADLLRARVNSITSRGGSALRWVS